jgi:TRAP-type C4-dicarboxylate transport system permease small subunit
LRSSNGERRRHIGVAGAKAPPRASRRSGTVETKPDWRVLRRRRIPVGQIWEWEVAVFIRILEHVVTALLGVIVVFVIAEVGLRTFAGYSLIVTDEISRYLMVWTAMLAAALLVHDDGHVRIALVTDLVPARLAKILYALSQLVVLFFLGVVIYTTLLQMPALKQQNTVTLGVSIAWFYAALPVAGAVMFLLTVRALILRLKESNGSG